MNAFAAATAALMADPNLALPALYKAGGAGPGVTVRVVRSAPDAVAQGFGAAVISATDVLTVAAADIPACASGDTFTIGADVLTAQLVRLDATGTAWRVECRRA